MRWMSKGPTAGAADTETQVGAADFTFTTGKDWTIKKIRVSYGHVVDAKSPCAVLELKIDTIKGPFKYIVGAGAGGAATTAIKKAEEIDVNIPVNGGAKVGAYVTFADAAVDVIIGLGYVPGRQGNLEYSDMPALDAATTADTATETLGTITTRTDFQTVMLKQIRVGLGAVVNAKSSGAKIKIGGIPDINADELEFPVFGQAPGATNSGPGEPEVIPLGIKVPGNTILTVYIYAVEATVESGFNIQYERVA